MLYKAEPHQAETIRFILEHKEAGVFLPCGMGKTVCTLTAFKMLKNRGMAFRMLVVAPIRPALVTWPDEIRKWDHTGGLSYIVLAGKSPQQRSELFKKKADIYIINRELVPWLLDEVKKEKICPFDMIVIDELSSFKNGKGPRTKAMYTLRCLPCIKRVVGLTGTPTPNGLLDLFSQIRILDKGYRLGNYITHYREKYFVPGKRHGNTVFQWNLKPGAEEEIYRVLKDIVISKKTNDSLVLPEYKENFVPVYLTAAQKEEYQQFKKDMIIDFINDKTNPCIAQILFDPEVLDGSLTDEKKNMYMDLLIENAILKADKKGHIELWTYIIDRLRIFALDTVTASSAGVLSNYLQQMANGGLYLNSGEETSSKHERPYKDWQDKKLEALEQLISEQQGEPCLVAYWFQHDKIRIKKYLKERHIDVQEIETADDIRNWNLGKYSVALIHPASASHGLNLQEGGHVLIWFSLTWSLEFYQQLNFRLYRKGQTSKSVIVHHLFTVGTVDEKILRGLRRKDITQENLLKAFIRDEMQGLIYREPVGTSKK